MQFVCVCKSPESLFFNYRTAVIIGWKGHISTEVFTGHFH